MIKLREILDNAATTLREINWKSILILCLFVASCALSWAWVDGELRSSMVRVEYAEKIKAYAGKLEEENQAVRDLLQEKTNSPEIWGLKLISEIVVPRVNVISNGLPKGREKAVCVMANKMLEGFGEVLLHDSRSAELTSDQKTFIFKLLRAESKYFNQACKKYN